MDKKYLMLPRSKLVMIVHQAPQCGRVLASTVYWLLTHVNTAITNTNNHTGAISPASTLFSYTFQARTCRQLLLECSK